MKTIESWVQDMKSQGAGFANALVVNLILAFITGTAILGFFLCAAKAYSSYMDEPIYTLFYHLLSALRTFRIFQAQSMLFCMRYLHNGS